VTRFYNALYAKLGDADLRQAHQPALFLNLVYRALKADTVMDRVTACSKKLLQVAELMNFKQLHLHLHLFAHPCVYIAACCIVPRDCC
jgi:CBF/Mak21 family